MSTSCEIFGHGYHEVTGKCGYCDAVLPPLPVKRTFLPDPAMPEVIRVNLRTIDGYSESRRFKTLKGARAYVAKKLGKNYDLGMAYAVDMYGVVKLTSNVPMGRLVG